VVERGGAGAVLTSTIRTVATTRSTNADCLALAAAGAAEGFWLRAETQTGGRGRQGRAWQSPPGNLYASTIVRLRPGDPPAATLGFVAAVALADAVIQAAGPLAALTLKWPNDVMIGGAKLAGILLERAGDAVVIGFGANLAAHPADLDRPTTSLAAQGRKVEPPALLDPLTAALATALDSWRGHGFAGIRQRWLALAHPPGTPLRVRPGDREAFEGRFDGLDSDGALILRLADGAARVIHAGDVFLI
jgi:BirA family biotin operon repressor/biotin-[acetyl-CoA-carboxylase] ligase